MQTDEKVEALKIMLNSAGWVHIVKPSIQTAIETWERHWLNGTRPEGAENISDETIKGRIWAFVWMKGWEDRLANLVHNLEAAQKAQAPEPEQHAGGSPYS
jgi:hypothetical protein